MISAWILLAIVSFQNAGDNAQTLTFRYLRPAGDKFVLESDITWKKTTQGTQYISITHRPKVTMTLTIHMTKKQMIHAAKTALETPQGKKAAKVRIDGKTAQIEQPGKKTQKITFDQPPVVVTTAPDWSDIIFLMRQYDYKKGGKQSFVGLWFHPVQPARKLTFTVEHLGKDQISAQGKKKTVGRYEVRLRSGRYLVWADATGLVYKLMPPDRPQAAVVLSGYEK